MADARTAVLMMAYGTPASRDEILPYYTDIRRGRPPTAEQLADLTRRYDAIGGLSPLTERTHAQRDALQAELDLQAPGEFVVTHGFKHATPMIEAAVEALATEGFQRAIALVLAPHYSSGSIAQYVDRARAAGLESGVDISAIDSWATEPAFIEFLSEDLRARLQKAPPATKVVFTAHSLPERIIAAGDPYPDELRATAEAVATEVGLGVDDWSIAWQSAGRTPEPWIGPDILQVIRDLGGEMKRPGLSPDLTAGARDPLDGEMKRPGVSPDLTAGVIVCACGFVADHLEVLYDIDIEARRAAEEFGLFFDRTACVNADPAVMAALATRLIATCRSS